MRNTIILLYHDIDSKDKPTEKEDLATKETVVRIEEFESHMDYLANEGYRVISLNQYFYERNQGKYAEKSIVLTFDDGHISNYEFALPVLIKHSFNATFFIIAENVGKLYYMGLPEIKELVDRNMEIGSHGLTHTYLTEISINEIKHEISESKRIIESIIEKPVEVFAYPGGHLNKNIIECVREQGYKAAVSCIVGRNTRKTNPYLLKRIEIRKGTSEEQFQRATKAISIMFFRWVDVGKSLLKRTISIQRYELMRQKFYRFYPFKR